MTKEQLKDTIENALYRYWKDDSPTKEGYTVWYYTFIKGLVDKIMELVDN